LTLVPLIEQHELHSDLPHLGGGASMQIGFYGAAGVTAFKGGRLRTPAARPRDRDTAMSQLLGI
jgi:hypothetical protein